MSTVDFNAPPANHKVSLAIEKEETPEDASYRRWKDKVIFVAALAVLVIAFLSCLGVLLFGAQPADEKKIWAGVLASILTGVLGYALGKK